MYNIPTWKNPKRPRKCNIKHTEPGYTWYYDLDSEDFESLVMKLKRGEILTERENDRYGKYLYTIIYITLGNPKFANKSHEERTYLFEQAILELLEGITSFDPSKGKLYSYAYRICYTSFCHYYTNKQQELEREQTIIEHCKEELADYYEEYSSHKTPRR